MNTLFTIAGTALFCGIAAGAAVHLLDRRRLARTERALHRSDQAREKLRLELETLNRLFADTAAHARSLGAGRADELAADAFDPVSGLLRERFVAVLIQQRVAGARRRLHPVAVVALEADGIRGSAQLVVDDAMRALGGVIRETLREADCACRVGDVVVIAALDDTTEDGARLGDRAGPGRAAQGHRRRRDHGVGRDRVLPDPRARGPRPRGPSRGGPPRRPHRRDQPGRHRLWGRAAQPSGITRRNIRFAA